MQTELIVNNLKLIKMLGINHSSGQIILTKITTLAKDNRHLSKCLIDTLINSGIESRYSAITNVGVQLADSAINADKKRLLPYFRATMNSLLDRFTPFDKYVSYNVSNGKIIYSKVTLDQGIKVVDDLIKDFK